MDREAVRQPIPATDEEVLQQQRVAVNLMRPNSDFEQIYTNFRSRQSNAQPQAVSHADAWAHATDQPERYSPGPITATSPGRRESRGSRVGWAGAAGAVALAGILAAQHSTAPPAGPSRRDRFRDWRYEHGWGTPPPPPQGATLTQVDEQEIYKERRTGNVKMVGGFIVGGLLVGAIWLGTEIFDDDDRDDNEARSGATTSQTTSAPVAPSTPAPTTPVDPDRVDQNNESDAAEDSTQPGESKKSNESNDSKEAKEGTTTRVRIGDKLVIVKTADGYRYYQQRLDYRGDVVWYHVQDILRHTGDRKFTEKEVWRTVYDEGGVGDYNDKSDEDFYHMDVREKFWVPIKIPGR